jgi:hypothetical protein
MTLRQREASDFRLRSLEQLESRNLLSGQALGAGFSQAIHGFLAAGAGQQFSANVAFAGDQLAAHHQFFAELGSFHSANYSRQTVLTASLTDPNGGTGTGTATYKTGTYDGETETSLTISVTGAAAGRSLAVMIGTTPIGTLATDSTGAGTLVLSSDPTGTEPALPVDFPTSITPGTIVSVDTLSGPLDVPTSSHGGGCESTQTSLTTTLADPNGGAGAGTASYTTSTKHGVTTTNFLVSVTGLTGGQTYDVLIGTTPVGSITADDTGAGSLALSSNPTGNQQALPAGFPTSIDPGTSVTVGTLTGNLATSTDLASSVGHFGRHR